MKTYVVGTNEYPQRDFYKKQENCQYFLVEIMPYLELGTFLSNAKYQLADLP